MSTQAMPISEAKPAAASAFNTAFIIAWLFCLLFYFMEYAVRAAPSVMLPELTAAFGLTTLGLSSLIGLYYYSYAAFGIVAGASVDRWGAKYTIPAGALILAAGTAMFGVNVSFIAGAGRFLQGAGAAFAFVAAVYRVPWSSSALSRHRNRNYPMRRHARRVCGPIRCRSADSRTTRMAAILGLCGCRDVVYRRRDVHRYAA
jgi:hypothetical protein